MERNSIDSVVNKITADIQRLQREADRNPGVPLGQVRLSPSEARRKWANLTEEQRGQMIQETGLRNVLNMFGSASPLG